MNIIFTMQSSDDANFYLDIDRAFNNPWVRMCICGCLHEIYFCVDADSDKDISFIMHDIHSDEHLQATYTLRNKYHLKYCLTKAHKSLPRTKTYGISLSRTSLVAYSCIVYADQFASIRNFYTHLRPMMQ